MSKKQNNQKKNKASHIGSVRLSFPNNKPTCCGKEMYPFGGVIGKRPDGIIGDIQHDWRCEICGKETIDLLN